MEKSFVRGTWQVKRAFSPAVITARRRPHHLRRRPYRAVR